MTDDSGIILPQCSRCKHLHRADPAAKCDAFPVAIPLIMLENRWDHRKPYPGDGGILFEPQD